MRRISSFRIPGIIHLIGRVAGEILCFRQILPTALSQLDFFGATGKLARLPHAPLQHELLAKLHSACQNLPKLLMLKRFTSGVARWPSPKLIESPDKFMAVLEKSGLLKSQHMEAVKSSELASSDPLTIARALLKKQLLTRWQAQQLLSGFYNLNFGKYTLCDQLGKGELGNVYLAENPKLGRKVALKTLSKRYVTEPEVVQPIPRHREGRVGAGSSGYHPRA